MVEAAFTSPVVLPTMAVMSATTTAADSALRVIPADDHRSLELWFGGFEASRITVELEQVASTDAIDLDGRRWRLAKTDACIAAMEITDLWGYLTSVVQRANASTVPGVLNGMAFRERCEDDLRVREPRFALFYVDLDNFRTVNASFGHDAGDVVLAAIAGRLTALVPDGRVGHLAGDRFLVSSGPLESAERAERLGERICRVVAQPVTDDGRTIAVTCSVGVSYDPELSVRDRIRRAETASGRASTSGGNRAIAYTETLLVEESRRLEMERLIRTGLVDGEFRVVFQPKVSLSTGHPVGAEALVRWRSATLGDVSPVDFIEIAEDTGLVVEIGQYVMDAACHEAASWPSVNPLARRLDINVNLSARQLALPDLVDRVDAVLAASGLDPHRLCLEITETAVVGDLDRAVATLTALRDRRIRIALDDFGVGYSSLSYLQRIPADVIKLDRSFIINLGTTDASNQDADLVRGVVNLARDLGREVVAEGIEREEQRRALMSLGCTMAQGFLFYRPLETPDIQSLIAGLR
jgi:diguanylate cyclase (GGDEF)-like protein